MNPQQQILIFGQSHHQFLDEKLNQTLIFAKTESEFNQILDDQSKNLLCSILDFPIVSRSLVGSSKMLRNKRPILPSFVLTEEEIPEEAQNELRRLSFQGVVTKETSLQELLVQIHNEVGSQFKTIDVDEGNEDELNKETIKGEDDFFPIRLKDLILGSTSFFDLYIRIAPKRFIKLMNKGEAVDREVVEKYTEKGVEFLFLLKVQHSKFLIFCDFLSEKIIQKESLASEIKTDQLMQYGDQVLKNFKFQGVTEQNIKFAQNFLSRGINLLKKVRPNANDKKEMILNAMKNYEHTTAMAILGGMLTQSMGYTSMEKINTISLAILLHDVGKLDLPEHLRGEINYQEISDEDREIYETHPRLGHDKVEGVEGINETVKQAILQHHERRDRTGFPDKISGNSINFVAEIIGICDTYLDYLTFHPGGHDEFMAQLDGELKLKFSSQLVEKFKTVFQK
jgi:HD-GYP domain-containing protein (c-di-GMP phosphodiesterase class II)